MPETAVKSPICDICGAEVRDESLFCYNCGGSVSKAEIKPAIVSNGEASVHSGPSAAAVERPQSRRRPVSRRGPVEIVWEPKTGVSVGFIIGSLFFVLIAIVLFISAIYLR